MTGNVVVTPFGTFATGSSPARGRERPGQGDASNRVQGKRLMAWVSRLYFGAQAEVEPDELTWLSKGGL